MQGFYKSLDLKILSFIACIAKKKVRAAHQKFLLARNQDVAGLVFADGPGPGAAAGGQESSEEAREEGKRRWRPETTARHVRQGEPGDAAAAQSLVYTVSFVYRPNTTHASQPHLYMVVFVRQLFFLPDTMFVLHFAVHAHKYK